MSVHHHHLFVFNDHGEFDHYLNGAFYHDHDPEDHYIGVKYVNLHNFGDIDIDDSACDDDCPWRPNDDPGVKY
jgi:hypothetical protein